MFTATKDKILPTTVTGSWPRPDWYDTDSGGERFAICRDSEGSPFGLSAD